MSSCVLMLDGRMLLSSGEPTGGVNAKCEAETGKSAPGLFSQQYRILVGGFVVLFATMRVVEDPVASRVESR